MLDDAFVRPVMTVIDVATGARVPHELTSARDFDRQVWLADTPPGGRVASELNPVLATPQPAAGG